MALGKIVASGRALAIIVLGIALVKVLFERMFNALTGMKLFLRNYGPDRLPPLDAEERAKMPTLGGCIACGRCDVGEGERIRAARGGYPGLMQLVLASSRSMPDFDAAARGFAFVPESVLREKRTICPTAVPFDELAKFVRHKADEIAHAPAAS